MFGQPFAENKDWAKAANLDIKYVAKSGQEIWFV